MADEAETCIGECLRDCCDWCITTRAIISTHVGQAVEAEDLAKLILDRGADAWKAGKHDVAEAMRHLSDEVRGRGRKHREAQARTKTERTEAARRRAARQVAGEGGADGNE